MRVVVGVIVASCLAVGCTKKNYFECTTSPDCDFLVGGTCIENTATGTSWCAAPDDTCPSGFRWDSSAVGDGVEGLCTSSVADADPASIDAGPECEQRIAFLSERDGVRNVFTMNPDGTNQTNVSAGGGADNYMSWSPLGDRLVYSRTDADIASLWVVNHDGSDNHMVTEDGVRDIQAAWTPDGQRIVFTRARTPSTFDLWSVAPDGSGLTKLTVGTSTSDHDPSVSPDGQRIAFVASVGAGPNVYVMSLDGSDRDNLTDDTTAVVTEGPPRWSPDSTSLLFVSNRSGNKEVWSVGATGANLRNLSQSAVPESHPRWFPSGSKILFARGTENLQLWTMNDDGSGQSTLDVLMPNDGDDAEISPDAASIAFTSIRDGDLEVYRASATGTEPTRLTNAPGFDVSPVWRPCP